MSFHKREPTIEISDPYTFVNHSGVAIGYIAQTLQALLDEDVSAEKMDDGWYLYRNLAQN